MSSGNSLPIAIKSKIAQILEDFPQINCFILALLLKAEFGGDIVYNGCHVMLRRRMLMTKAVYHIDREGIHKLDSALAARFLPMPVFQHALTPYGWEQQRELLRAAFTPEQSVNNSCTHTLFDKISKQA